MNPEPVPDLIHPGTNNFLSHLSMFSVAFEAAIEAIGVSAPNPSVGAVIIDRRDRRILATGSTKEPGKEHAEISAISAVKRKFPEEYATLLQNSSMYVTLEPCSHFGRTPPCSLAIRQNKIPEINIALRDPSDKVNGTSIRSLLEAGHTVRLLDKAVLMQYFAEAFSYTLAPFFSQEINKRPLILLKWAQNKNGFLAPEFGKSGPISSGASRGIVHRMRRIFQSTMVSPNAIRCDHPRLDFRIEDENNNLMQLKFPIADHHRFNILKAFRKKLFSIENLPSVDKKYTRIFLLPNLSKEWNAANAEEWISQQKRIDTSKGMPLFVSAGIDKKSVHFYHDRIVHQYGMEYLPMGSIQEIWPILNEKEIGTILFEAGPFFADYLMQNNLIDIAFAYISPSSRWPKGRSFSLASKIEEIGTDDLPFYLSSVWEIGENEKIEKDILKVILSKNIESLI